MTTDPNVSANDTAAKNAQAASEIVAAAKVQADAILADAKAKADAASAATSGETKDHMIPKSRLDAEIAKRNAAEGELDKVADGYLAEIPENLKALVPEGLSAIERIAWFQKAKATGVFGETKPKVPATDGGNKGQTLTSEQLSQLPAVAKMAAGYNKR